MSVEQSAADGPVEAQTRIAQLEAALESRSTIARAQGLLMERYNIDADGAIAILKRASSTMNVKVRAVAAMLVETRQLPRPIERHEERAGPSS
ncbi:MAG TPA: ANTAR domain-containing protein [Nocardioides sp.]|nr:ANTAR domain-containing protein [Nocardioides sp.]